MYFLEKNRRIQKLLLGCNSWSSTLIKTSINHARWNIDYVYRKNSRFILNPSNKSLALYSVLIWWGQKSNIWLKYILGWEYSMAKVTTTEGMQAFIYYQKYWKPNENITNTAPFTNVLFVKHFFFTLSGVNISLLV